MHFYNTADVSSMYFLFQKTLLSVYASCLNEESSSVKHTEQMEC